MQVLSSLLSTVYAARCREKVVIVSSYTTVCLLGSFLCTYTHARTHTFNGPFSGTTQVSQYQKGKTNLDFTEARDSAFSALTLLVGRQEGHPVCKKQWWGAGVVVCLEQGADLHIAQLMPLPFTVSCSFVCSEEVNFSGVIE